MAKSPFSTAGGGDADSKPHAMAARKHGGRVEEREIREDGGSAVEATKKEAKGKSIGFVEGEDSKPRLDRKCGGAAKRAKGGKVRGRK